MNRFCTNNWRLLSCLSFCFMLFNTTSALSLSNSLDSKTAVKKMIKSTKGTFEPTLNIADAVKIKQPAINEENPEIFFSADELENNQEMEIITATGNVEIIRNNMTVKANKIVYNQKDDVVTAVGDVVLLQDDGTVVFSNFAELTNQMSQGEMENIKIIMADKTRIAAQSMLRLEKDNKIMTNVVYSPCDVCQNEDPLWQLKSKNVEHNAETKDVYYKDATLEVKGIPVFYTPFLSHPDPSVKRRSGFLFPKVSSNSYLGAALQPQYFWDIDEHQNMLFSPILSTDKGLILGAGYNKNFYRGELNASGTFMNDPDTKEDRGNLFLNGRYEINDFWVADTDINYASDNTYLKDLSLPKKDDAWLTSMARMQGFDNRNYASVEAYYYTILSNDLQDVDKPIVVPLLNYENISDTDPYGAYTKTNLSFASVMRDEDASTQRATMINSWNLPYTSPYGEKYRLAASVKSDMYYVDNYQYMDKDAYNGAVGRVFPQVGLEWRLPFVRATEDSRQILEPVIVAVAAPNDDNKIDRIPNEDSQDVDLDDTNILDLDRYAGYDRNDTGSRVSYGVNWSAYGNDYGRSSFFLAQSYKFDKEESFTSAEEQGQNGYLTDYVGRAYVSPNEYFDLNYRFKLDKDDYSVTYSELSSSIGPRILNAYISYIYFPGGDNSSIDNGQTRKELYTAVNSAISKDWYLSIYNRQDLMENGGSLEHGGTLTYEDECSKFLIIARKYNSSDPEFEDGSYEITFSFFLKTLGGVGSK